MSQRQTNATDMMMLWSRGWQLWAEASMVVSMRMMGMAGLWATSPSETLRMVTEKPAALGQSMIAGATAAGAGKRPDQIASAALRPLTRKTRANRRRLAKAGPTLPGRSS